VKDLYVEKGVNNRENKKHTENGDRNRKLRNFVSDVWLRVTR